MDTTTFARTDGSDIRHLTMPPTNPSGDTEMATPINAGTGRSSASHPGDDRPSVARHHPGPAALRLGAPARRAGRVRDRGHRATAARGDAARQVALRSAPEWWRPQNLYSSVADADATASTIFLQAGQESPALRHRYLDDIDRAGTYLASVARSSQSSAAYA